MKTNLGQLLQHIAVLDEASSGAPLNRNQHVTVATAAQQLRDAVQSLYATHRDVAIITKRIADLEHALTELLPEATEPLRHKLAALLKANGNTPVATEKP